MPGRADYLVERRGFEMMAIVAFGPSKSKVVTFSPCSGAWRLNPLGGIEWGTSTEGEQIYAAITNGSHKDVRLHYLRRAEEDHAGRLMDGARRSDHMLTPLRGFFNVLGRAKAPVSEGFWRG